MDLLDFHTAIRFYLNKEQGGWASPEEIDDNGQLGQMAWYVACLPYYGKDQKFNEPLSTFYTKQLFTTASDGKITLPTNDTVIPCYESLAVVNVSYYDGTRQRYKGVKLLPEDQISERLDSQTLMPTVTNPAGEDVKGGIIQLYPLAVMSGNVTYLRLPAKPNFVYSQAGNPPVTSGLLTVGRYYYISNFVAGDDFSNVASVQSGIVNTNGCTFIASGTTPTNWTNGSTLTPRIPGSRTPVYNKAASTQFEWDDLSMNKIIIKTLSIFGINLSDQEMLQYTEMKNAQDM